MKYALVYITCGSLKDTQRIAQILVKKKLVACVNYLPVTSVYRWEGKIQNDTEYLLLCKTRRGHFDKIKDEVVKIHPYDIPAITLVPVLDGYDKYLQWVAESTK